MVVVVDDCKAEAEMRLMLCGGHFGQQTHDTGAHQLFVEVEKSISNTAVTRRN
jgi:hypothetical protein